MNPISLLLTTFLVATAALTTASRAQVTVSNFTVAQRPGTKLVDISYDVASTTASTVAVKLEVKNAGTPITAISLTGDVGASVTTGTGKAMVWDMGADWNVNAAAGVTFSVAVDIAPPNMPAGGDPTAVSWVAVNARWVKNTYANGDITMSDHTNNNMWLYNANPCGTKNGDGAISYCKNLT